MKRGPKPREDRETIRSVRVVVKCTPEEARTLEEKAGPVPLGRYLREAGLSQVTPKPMPEIPMQTLAIIARAKTEILADIAEGRVPSTVTTFAELHDFADANEYGGLCEIEMLDDDEPGYDEDAAEAHNAMCNRVQNTLDAWIRAGRA